MSYAPATDFIALLRLTNTGLEQLASMPGLDYVLAALARAGQFRLWTGQSAPTSNQNRTVWLKPAQPSWTAEGAVYLWDSETGTYAPATPDLWLPLFSPTSAQVFQSTSVAADVVTAGVTLLAIERNNPAVTTLELPPLVTRAGAPLRIVDWSSNVVDHQIELSTPDGATVMRRASWSLWSTADQLASVSLYPVSNLNGWVIA